MGNVCCQAEGHDSIANQTQNGVKKQVPTTHKKIINQVKDDDNDMQDFDTRKGSVHELLPDPVPEAPQSLANKLWNFKCTNHFGDGPINKYMASQNSDSCIRVTYDKHDADVYRLWPVENKENFYYIQTVHSDQSMQNFWSCQLDEKYIYSDAETREQAAQFRLEQVDANNLGDTSGGKQYTLYCVYSENEVDNYCGPTEDGHWLRATYDYVKYSAYFVLEEAEDNKIREDDGKTKLVMMEAPVEKKLDFDALKAIFDGCALETELLVDWDPEQDGGKWIASKQQLQWVFDEECPELDRIKRVDNAFTSDLVSQMAQNAGLQAVFAAAKQDIFTDVDSFRNWRTINEQDEEMCRAVIYGIVAFINNQNDLFEIQAQTKEPTSEQWKAEFDKAFLEDEQLIDDWDPNEEGGQYINDRSQFDYIMDPDHKDQASDCLRKACDAFTDKFFMRYSGNPGLTKMHSLKPNERFMDQLQFQQFQSEWTDDFKDAQFYALLCYVRLQNHSWNLKNSPQDLDDKPFDHITEIMTGWNQYDIPNEQIYDLNGSYQKYMAGPEDDEYLWCLQNFSDAFSFLNVMDAWLQEQSTKDLFENLQCPLPKDKEEFNSYKDGDVDDCYWDNDIAKAIYFHSKKFVERQNELYDIKNKPVVEDE